MTKKMIWASFLIPCLLVSVAFGCASMDSEGDIIIETEVVDIMDTTDGAVACTTDNECDDGIACTIDHCEAGECAHEPCADCCPDGLTCLPNYGCGPAPVPCITDEECVDGIRCTLDRCLDETFCQNIPQHSLCEEGEICLAALGCIPMPPDSCEDDDDCFPDRPCLGDWYCDPEFGCQFISILDCSDDDPCTDDECDDEAGGCVYPIKDADDDGYGDIECGGDDCDDENPDINPGAEELCNEIDDDCDGTIDENCCEEGAECTTSCGTTGTRECNPDGTEGDCVPPPEECNGEDDNCDGSIDEDFECSPPETVDTCTTSCGSEGTRECLDDCSWGDCVPPDELCNGEDDDCDGTVDNGFACIAGTLEDCTSSCGTAGTRECLGNCTWDECVPPIEVCNGVDDDCDGVADNGFTCAAGSTVSCTTSCGSTGTRQCLSDCTWDVCIPPSESCNGLDDDCDGTPDNGFACVAGSTSSCPTSCGSTGTRQCLGDCTWDLCTPPAEECNGVDDDCDGVCDDGFTCCARETMDCSLLGYYGGTAICLLNCSAWDTTGCTNCGDGRVDTGEECDDMDLDGNDCTTIGMGFAGGTLQCSPTCSFDTSLCHYCGNGTIDFGEECDTPDMGGNDCTTIPGGYTGGTLGCTSSCTFDTTECTGWDPSGLYVVTPTISYWCAFGLVNLNISTFTFSDSGAVLVVNGAPCAMTGSSAMSTRHIDVTCTLFGSCDEIYSLTGDFDTDDHWTGTFSATFVGSCLDCVSQSWPVQGQR